MQFVVVNLLLRAGKKIKHVEKKNRLRINKKPEIIKKKKIENSSSLKTSGLARNFGP